MILAWLSSRFLGLSRGIWLLGAVIALGGLIVALRASENADDRHNQDLGASQQREADQAETIKRVGEGNAAREEMRNPASRARYDECLRSARTPANCVRFLPQRQEADD